jgi:ATP phosphoribosyltransferase
VYTIFDAFNECLKKEELLNFLKVVTKQKIDQLLVLVPRRQLPDFKEALDSVGAQRIVLQRGLVAHDIKTYVHESLHRSSNL